MDHLRIRIAYGAVAVTSWAIAVALLILMLALAGCGHPSAPAVHHAPASSAPAVPGITCADIGSDLQIVVSDLKTEDAKLQEAWVSGGA
jgi:hypothetical protein